MGEPLLSPGLGFPSLESLLRSLPDVCTLRYSAGQLMVMGVASSATAHVQDMVAKQNTSRRGMKRGGANFNGVSTGGFRGAGSGKLPYRPNFEGSFHRFQSSNYFLCPNEFQKSRFHLLVAIVGTDQDILDRIKIL